MACSKPIVPPKEGSTAPRIHKIEVLNYTNCIFEDAMSMDVIFGKLSGPDNYYCCNLEDSLHCYKTCKDDILKVMDEMSNPVFFFEELQTDLNIFIVVLHQKRDKTNREHMILHALVQMTLITVLKVVYCRNYKIITE